MRGWIIFGSICLGLILIGFIRVRLHMKYSSQGEEGFSLKLRVLFYRRSIVPSPRQKIRLRDYTPKKIEVRERKAALKAAKKAEKKRLAAIKKLEKKQAAKNIPKEDKLISSFSDVTELVALILECVGVLLKKLFWGLHTKIDVLRLSVGGDPAKAAVKYGVIQQSVLYLLALLEDHSKLRFGRHRDGRTPVEVDPGFGQDSFAAEVDMRFSISVGAVLAVLLVTIWRFLVSKHNRILGKLLRPKKKAKGSDEKKTSKKKQKSSKEKPVNG
jgi:hypothetical protein